ncbi:MAG: hypothetical protein A3H96_11500 [Acidobacteria bacterium RIFCSPLOWO2_02_FULL_67_36]|nr:MAG: hypothetical protein A3H96_11500 [Acidobacteria bacterium RIFCSPLOWO2_02_FULL_67_36]OGA76282.1 MAG: hypothetical protein A3G27_05715 [Betaproteobacteria bacterium RIFCSPLOWO2_12_FULL_66_14]
MHATAELLALLGLLETLKKQSRAGINPPPGVVEDVFRYADAVRDHLAARESDVDEMRAALDAADRYAQETQVRILLIQHENVRLRECVGKLAEAAAEAIGARVVTPHVVANP